MKNFETVKRIFMGIIEALENDAEFRFFKNFNSVPSTYFGITSINGSETIRSTIFNGHVVRDNYGRIIVVTEQAVNGSIRYIERSLFNGGETDITDDIEDDFLFSGSIEQCWYRWYQLQEENK